MDPNYNSYNNQKQYYSQGYQGRGPPHNNHNNNNYSYNNHNNHNNHNYNNSNYNNNNYNNYSGNGYSQQGYQNYNNNYSNNQYQGRRGGPPPGGMGGGGQMMGGGGGMPYQRRPKSYAPGGPGGKGMAAPYQPYPAPNTMPRMKVNRHRQIQDCHFPKPRPSDPLPLPNENSIKIISYNILADSILDSTMNLYINLNSGNYPQEKEVVPDWLEWKYRLDMLVAQLTNTGLFNYSNSSQKEYINADVVCLQEVDRYEEIDDRLKQFQFKGIFAERSNSQKDGCAIFYRDDRLCLLDYEIVEYRHLIHPDHPDNADPSINNNNNNNNNNNDDEEEDKSIKSEKERIAIIAIFKKRTSQGSDLQNNKPICVVNTQIIGNPKKPFDTRLSQIHFLTSEIEKTILNLSKDEENKITTVDTCPTILCGDFSSNPQTPVYSFLKDGYHKIEPFKYQFWAQYFNEFEYAPNTYIAPSESQNTMCIKHNIKLKSSYSEILNGKEPLCTIIHKRQREPVDYIWYSCESMNLKRTLPLSKEICINAQLPNRFHPSDHLLLAAEFSII